jgi:hypothetical protein
MQLRPNVNCAGRERMSSPNICVFGRVGRVRTSVHYSTRVLIHHPGCHAHLQRIIRVPPACTAGGHRLEHQ